MDETEIRLEYEKFKAEVICRIMKTYGLEYAEAEQRADAGIPYDVYSAGWLAAIRVHIHGGRPGHQKPH